jgi:predicted Zn-dependent protease
MVLSEKEAKAVCDKLLSYVKGDDAEVSVRSSDDSHLRFAANAVATSGRRQDVEVGVTVWIEQKKASASTNELDEASLQAVVAEAEALARVSPVDVEYVPSLGPQRYEPVGGYVEATTSIALAERARAIGDVITACEKDQVVGAGFHQASGSLSAGATQPGNFYQHRASVAGLSVTARTPEGNGSGYFARNHFDVAKLDTARIAREAIQKALRSREPRTLDAGVYTVVLEPQAVADLLEYFPRYFDARSADEGRSPFSAPGNKTRRGERVFDERLNLYSDPWHPELPGSPAAQSGIPAQKVYLVRSGVLETLIYTRYWAKKKDKEPTPGPVNAILESSAPPVSLEDMVKDTQRGLLVSRFWYIRTVEPRTAAYTGLTRDGVWYVENGKIQYPVRNFRFNQSLLQMLAAGNVELVGAPERVGGPNGDAGLFPALKVKQFHFTSLSEAV